MLWLQIQVGEILKLTNQNNKYSLKSFNYHANYTQGSNKTTTNKKNQNFAIRYSLVKKDQAKNNQKKVSGYSKKSKSTLREEGKLKRNNKSTHSLSNKTLSTQKSKQKLSREKIRFRPDAKVSSNFHQSKPFIGKMIPPKTQRESQYFFNSSTQISHAEDYS